MPVIRSHTICKALIDAPGSVLLDDWDIAGGGGWTHVFTSPREIITAESAAELQSVFDKIGRLQSEGMYLAGYIAYDAGLALDKPLTSRHKPDIPLVWLGVYESVQLVEREDADLGDGDEVELISSERLNVTESEYLHNIARVKEYIGAGDVYQVNYTCKLLFDNAGTASGLFARLRAAHPVCHSAFINAGEFQVISLSPELFLRNTSGVIRTRPMKGTIKRGLSYTDDLEHARALKMDEKGRAENVMIVDLMRNDLGRISRSGSVRVPKLFEIERYRSLLQMTSEVEGTLRDGVGPAEVFASTFPPGSVTGAPKLRAVEIIDELESSPRGIYCGSIGMFEPDGNFLLNVAIRTIVQRGRQCEMGIGSGIVADSNPRSEFAETLLKSSFLKLQPQDFSLLETLAYDKEDGFAFIEEHLARMRRSARYFGRRFDGDIVRAHLQDTADEIMRCSGDERFRVRVLADDCGEVSVQWTPINNAPERPVRLLLSSRQIDPENVFLYHKTTNRREYNEDLRCAREAGFYDVLYTNTRGELAECATTNIMLQIDGCWYTPPVCSGLLPGILRQASLCSGQMTERVLSPDDFTRASRIAVCNSVRGEIEVGSVEDGSGILWRSGCSD